MLAVKHRLLIGPLYNPGVLGAYAQAENIRLFMHRSVHCQRYTYDLVYDPAEIRHFNDIFKYLPSNWEPELVLWWDPIYQPLPPGIEDCPYPTALIPGDWNLGFVNCEALFDKVDLICADLRLSRILAQRGLQQVLYFPGFAFEPDKFYADPGLERPYDVTFVGSLNPSVHATRSAYLAQILSLQARYRLCLRQGVWGEDYRRLLNQSKIVFNYTIRRELNLRAYEAPACGALLFLEAENEEARLIFEDRVSCVFYTAENLLALLVYYLEHEEERATIAAAGHQVIQKHTYAQSFERLLQQIELFLQAPAGHRRQVHQVTMSAQIQALNLLSSSGLSGSQAALPHLESLRQVLLHEHEPADCVWELHALLVMLFPYFDEQQKLHAFCGTSLLALQAGFFQLLALAPQNPILHYHYALTCEYLGQYELALTGYQDALARLSSVDATLLEAYKAFILPFNKSGRGAMAVAAAWEQIHYEALETGQEIHPLRQRLLAGHIWQRIAQLQAHLQQGAAALEAYQKSFAFWPQAELLFQQAQVYQQLELETEMWQAFEQALVLQPLLIQDLDRLLSAQGLVKQAAKIQALVAPYGILEFKSLQRLACLVDLVLWAQDQHQMPESRLWLQTGLKIEFSSDFYQTLCYILRKFSQSPALKSLQALLQPFMLRWAIPFEPMPKLEPDSGFFWSQADKVPTLGPNALHTWHRTYLADSQLEQRVCATDIFPILLPEPEALRPHELLDELIAGARRVCLLLLSQWPPTALRAWFEAHASQNQPEDLLVLWSPAQAYSLQAVENLLPLASEAQFVWLDEALQLSDAQQLLLRSQVVLLWPEDGPELYFGHLAQALGVPVACPGQAPDGQADLWLKRVNYFSELWPQQGPVEVATSCEPGRWQAQEAVKFQAWLQGLWRLRLQFLLDNSTQ